MLIADKTSTVYAEALLDLAVQQKKSELIEEQAHVVSGLLVADPAIWAFFKSPILQVEEKLKVIERALQPQVDALLYNFLGVLIRRRRFYCLPKIAMVFSELLDRKLGRRRVEVATAMELDEKQRQEFRKGLEAYFKGPVIATFQTENDLIGGVVVRCGDIVLDDSIQHNLLQLKGGMMQHKIRGRNFYEN